VLRATHHHRIVFVHLAQADTDKFYRLLGVDKDADADTIRKAYRKLALKVRWSCIASLRHRRCTPLHAPPLAVSLSPRRSTPTRAETRRSSRS